ncbi:Mariner Mos1 transposase [Eumeta japonica]|uniref:Mariner Mos1 transposase n=1 Tax=Eumeta variegata TaxID=151549 RepID=A0A4C1YG52_EUMVA|nr:Mariner Mos1 transposase [Eumeta japonica]
MLCVWWDWESIINYELLPSDKTINLNLYCQQLMRLKQEVEKKQPELINGEDETSKSRMSPPPIDIRATPNAWPPFWERIGYLMDGDRDDEGGRKS